MPSISASGASSPIMRVGAIDVVLPADPGDAEPLAEGPAIAHRDLGRRQTRRGAVDETRNQLASAIGQLDHQAAVAAGGILRDQQAEVGGEAHASLGVTRRQIEVNDVAVGFVLRVDAEGDRAVEPVVRTGLAE